MLLAQCASPSRRSCRLCGRRPDAGFRHARRPQMAVDRPSEHGRPHHRRRRRSQRSRRRSTSPAPPAACGRRSTPARRSFRSGITSRSRRSATSPSRRAIRRSSTSARARATRATASRPAGACTSRSTAASPGSRLGLEKTQHIGRIVIHPTNPNIVYVAARRRDVGLEPGARPVQDDRRRQDLDS